MSSFNTNENNKLNSVENPEKDMECSEPVSAKPTVENTNQVKHHQHRHSVKSRYEFLQTLGKGTYGKVRLARQRESNQYVAIKSIRKDKVGQLNMTHIRREMEILSQISHPNIIKIYEVFENQDKIVIVMEYASGGELYDFITKHKNLNELQAKHFFSQIVSALRYCHKQGIVHRDLKLENILLDKNNQIKIADFGLANRFNKESKLTTFCGSPLYASPEIVSGTPYTGPEVDSWSLGVLLYALVYGTMPFDGNNYSLLSKKITGGDYVKQPVISNAHSLIDWLLQVNPLRRATIEQVYHHKWLATQNSPPARNNKPKSILKQTSTTVGSPVQQQRPPLTTEAELDGQLAKVCGVHNARDSLKLKNNGKLHHSIVTSLMNHQKGRRVLRATKRDHRESGYYSSPERPGNDSSSASSNCSNKSPTNTKVDSEKVKMRLQKGQLQVPTLERLASGHVSSPSNRPNSAYSDSSILSSEDSFNLCQFTHNNTPAQVSTPPVAFVSNQPSRPVSMPILHESQFLNQQPTSLHSPRPGTLSPESEQLLRGLERILMPQNPRQQRQHLKSAPSTYSGMDPGHQEPGNYNSYHSNYNVYNRQQNYHHHQQYSPQVYHHQHTFNYNQVFGSMRFNYNLSPQQQQQVYGTPNNQMSSPQNCVQYGTPQQVYSSHASYSSLQPETSAPASCVESQPSYSVDKSLQENSSVSEGSDENVERGVWNEQQQLYGNQVSNNVVTADV